MKELSLKEIELINKVIDGVVARLRNDADLMDLDPRHCGKVESIVTRQRFIADWIDKDRSDIMYDIFEVDFDFNEYKKELASNSKDTEKL